LNELEHSSRSINIALASPIFVIHADVGVDGVAAKTLMWPVTMKCHADVITVCRHVTSLQALQRSSSPANFFFFHPHQFLWPPTFIRRYAVPSMDPSDLGSAIDDSFKTTIFPGGCRRRQANQSNPPQYRGRQSGHWNISSSTGSGIDDRCPTVWNDRSTTAGRYDGRFQSILSNSREGSAWTPHLLSRLHEATKRDREEKIRAAEANDTDDDPTDTYQGSRNAPSKLPGASKSPAQSKHRGFYLPHECFVSNQRANSIGRNSSPPSRIVRRPLSDSRSVASGLSKSREEQLAPVKREMSQREKDAIAAAQIMLASVLLPADFMRATGKDEESDEDLDGGYSRPGGRTRYFATARDFKVESEAVTSSSSKSSDEITACRLNSAASVNSRQSDENNWPTSSTKSLQDAVLRIDANSYRGSATGTTKILNHALSGGSDGRSNSAPRPDSGDVPKNTRPTVFAGRGWVSPHPLSVTPSEHATPPQAKVKVCDGKEMTYEEFKAMQASVSVVSESVRSIATTLAGSGKKQLKMPWDNDGK